MGALGLHAATQTTNFEPVAATVGDARLLALAVTQYAQDYDERLPNTQSTAAFDAALRPYVPDPAVFVSRVTGKPFVPNAAISGKTLTEFADFSTVALFRDTVPPSKTPATVGFLDGHVERSGVVQGDPKLLSLGNAQALAVGVIEYTQDNDEIFPPTTTQAAFQTALLPYVRNARDFVDPLNGKPFLPNPAVSQVSESSIADPSQTVVFQSQKPDRNGVPIIGYADGHITPALLTSPGLRDLSQLKQIGLATVQYTQDYDETLPLTTDYSTFEAELVPYTKSSQIFQSPGNGLPYVLNPAVSGVSLGSIDNPDLVELARDTQLNADGTLNHLEVDGRVRQDAYFVPLSVAIGPDSLTHLLWPSAKNQASLWTLMPGSTLKTTDTERGTALGFSIGADNQTRVLWNGDVSLGTLVTPITGTAVLDTLDPSSVLLSSQQFGPYDGWAALLLATGPDNSSRLLWQRYNGTLALWTLSAQGGYEGSSPVPALTGGTPVGMVAGGDGLVRLLWKTSSGEASLWTLAPSGQVLRRFTFPSPSGQSPTGLSLGVDDASRLLWSDGKDNASVRVVAATTGKSGAPVSLTLPGGGTATQIAVGKSGDLRLLWMGQNGSGKLQTLTAAGTQTSVQALTPYL